jgi:hypothetical protein
VSELKTRDNARARSCGYIPFDGKNENPSLAQNQHFLSLK